MCHHGRNRVRSTHLSAIISATVVCSARLQLACGMAAGFVWLALARSGSLINLPAVCRRLKRARFVRLESSTLERSGSLTSNNPAPTAARGVQHRDTGRVDLISSGSRIERERENQPARDSQRRGLAGARAPDNPLTIYTDHCYRLKLIHTQIIVGTNRHSNGEPQPSHQR